MGDCLRELRVRAAVGRVIEVALAANGPSYHYVANLIDTETGRTLGQIARKCDVCTTEEAFLAASLAVVELVNGVGDAAPEAKPVDPGLPAARARVARARSRARLTGAILVGAAVAAGAASYYFYRDDRDGLGAGAAGAAGGLAAAGAVAFGVSFSF